eukprot:COSAG01_NODE_3058_length_6654_cov_3.122636_5_plen_296_part_00
MEAAAAGGSSTAAAAVARGSSSLRLPDYPSPVGYSFEAQPTTGNGAARRQMFSSRDQWKCAAFAYVCTGRGCICTELHLGRYQCACFALLSRAEGAFSVREQYVPPTVTVNELIEGRKARRSSHRISLFALATNGDGGGPAYMLDNGNAPFITWSSAGTRAVKEKGFYEHAATPFLKREWGRDWRGGVLGNKGINVKHDGKVTERRTQHYYHDPTRLGASLQRDPPRGTAKTAPKHRPFEMSRLLCLDGDVAGPALMRQRARDFGVNLFDDKYCPAMVDRLVAAQQAMVRTWLPW